MLGLLVKDSNFCQEHPPPNNGGLWHPSA